MDLQRRKRRGAVLVWMTLTLVVLIGFIALTTDYGLLVVNKRHLQNGTDAAALSAALPLVDSSSTARQQSASAGRQYASDNGVPGAVVTVSNTTLPYEIQVDAKKAIDTPFARVLSPKFASGTVAAHSTVEVTPATKMTRLKPWAIPYGFFSGDATYSPVAYNQLVKIRITDSQSQSDPSGRLLPFFSPINLGGGFDSESSPYPNYQSYIETGYPNALSIADWAPVYSEKGTLNSALDNALVGDGNSALMTRIQTYGDDGTNWKSPSTTDPALIFVPIIDHALGAKGAHVLGFAAFYIDGPNAYDSSNGGSLRGRFIKVVIPASTDVSNDVTLPAQSYPWGPFTYRLVK